MISFDSNRTFQENYKILIGSVIPRPISVVSTINDDNTFNLAPFSFFTAVSALPMILAFCPLIRSSDGKKKDTVINIERQKEFVLHVCTEDMAEKINAASSELKYGESEFDFAGLTPMASKIVKPPRLKESPIHFECRLRDIISYGEGIGAGRLITGEVVMTHIDPKIYHDGKIITQKLKPVARGAGNDWFRCSDVFQLERNMISQIQK